MHYFFGILSFSWFLAEDAYQTCVYKKIKKNIFMPKTIIITRGGVSINTQVHTDLPFDPRKCKRKQNRAERNRKVAHKDRGKDWWELELTALE